MSYDVTHELCCQPDPQRFSWRNSLTGLLQKVIGLRLSPKRNGIVDPLPGLDARAMADIGLGKFGSDFADPTLQNVSIRHEMAMLDKMDRFGR